MSDQAAPSPQHGVRSVYRPPTGDARRDLPANELDSMIAQAVDGKAEGTLWLDVDVETDDGKKALEAMHCLHPLAVEDAGTANSRPKVEEYPGYLFMILRGLRFVDESPDPYDVEGFNLSFFLARGVVISVRHGQSPALEDVWERVQKSPDVLERGTDRLLHTIMDATVDAYFPLLDQIDGFVDQLEQQVIAHFDTSALAEIFAVKRIVLSLKRHLGPEREVFNVLTNRPTDLLSTESQIYFRDIYDHVLRLNDSVDTYRELLSSVLDSYLTQVSNRLGRVTKGLSVIATVSIPFVVISGMWGMNVRHIPFADRPDAFWWMLGFQIVLGLLLLAVLRFRKLF
jgi:magnesium transporter